MQSIIEERAEGLRLTVIDPAVERFYADPTEDNWVTAWKAVSEMFVAGDQVGAIKNTSLLAKKRPPDILIRHDLCWIDRIKDYLRPMETAIRLFVQEEGKYE